MGKKHLTEKDRYAIEKMLKKKMKVKEIAEIDYFAGMSPVRSSAPYHPYPV